MDHESVYQAGRSSLNPPLPEASIEEAPGQQLLSLLRTLEKDPAVLDQVIDSLHALVVVTTNLGLLQGDTELADSIGHAKGGRKETATESLDPKNESTALLDIQLVLSGIQRILDSHASEPVLVTLAADFACAASEFVKERHEGDKCMQAEYELLATSGKSWLSGLEKFLSSTLDRMALEDGLRREHDDEVIAAIRSSLRASASLVSLFGTKLSRSASLTDSLQVVAWKALEAAHDDVMFAASVLIASLTSTGGTDRISPSDLWNRLVEDSVSLLSKSLASLTPFVKEGSYTIHNATADMFVSRCSSAIRSADTDRARVDTFLHMMRALVTVFECALSREARICGADGTSHYLRVAVDVPALLDLSETLLSFPVSSESLFFGTKKRLRNEASEDSEFSPLAFASELSNPLKHLGLRLLSSSVQALGGPSLQPYAKRILQLGLAAFQSSASPYVKRAVESSAMPVSKRRRWLHSSLVLRSESATLLADAIRALGIGETKLAKDRSSTKGNSSIGERSVKLACGMIVEGLSESSHESDASSWGSPSQHTDTVSNCLRLIEAFLQVGGELCTPEIRSLVDSVLEHTMSQTGMRSASASLLMHLLAAARANYGVYWGDGSRCSMTETAAAYISRLRDDRDPLVSSMALSLLRSREALVAPRVPALTIVRSLELENEQSFRSLEQGLEAAAEEEARRQANKLSTSSQKRPRTEGVNSEEGDALTSQATGHQSWTPPAVVEPVHQVAQSFPTETTNDRTQTPIDEVAAKVNAQQESAMSSNVRNEQSDDEDMDFPVIVDGDPDNDDMDE